MKRVKDRVGLLLRVAVEMDSKKSVFGAKLKVVNVFVVSGHGELWTPATCCCCCSYVLSCLLRECCSCKLEVTQRYPNRYPKARLNTFQVRK